MDRQNEKDAKFREFVLAGRTPTQFLIDEDANGKKIHNNLLAQGKVAGEYSDLQRAEAFIGYVQNGIVTETDIETALPALGLTFDQVHRFMEEMIPQAQKLMEVRTQHFGQPRITGIRVYGDDPKKF